MESQPMQSVAYPSDGPGVSANSDGIQSLLDRWEQIEARATELSGVADSEMSGVELGSSAQAKLAQLSHEIEREQQEILKNFAEIPAEGLGDMLAKLKVWKSMVCPTVDDEAYLQPADYLALSVFRDLSRLQG